MGRKLAKGLMALGATIWGFGLGLWAFGPEAEEPAWGKDYPGVTVQELKTMPKEELKAYGKTYRQVVELQDGGNYTEQELEDAKSNIEMGCSVYEDGSYNCTVESYEDKDGVPLRVEEGKHWGFIVGDPSDVQA